MPVTKSADLLLAELSATVKGELLATIGPIARRIAEAAAELESALSGGGRRGRRGRRRGPGRPAAAKPGRKRGRSADGKLPRGAMRETLVSIVGSAGAPMKLARIRDAVLARPEYRGRDEKGLYTQIINAIKKVKEIRRTASGEYSLRGR